VVVSRRIRRAPILPIPRRNPSPRYAQLISIVLFRARPDLRLNADSAFVVERGIVPVL